MTEETTTYWIAIPFTEDTTGPLTGPFSSIAEAQEALFKAVCIAQTGLLKDGVRPLLLPLLPPLHHTLERQR